MEDQQQNQPQSGFNYTGGNPVPEPQEPYQSSANEESLQSASSGIQWQASEFIDHQKGVLWFVPLIVFTICISGLGYLFTRSILTSIVVFAGALAFGVYAHQKPRTVVYALKPRTIKVDSKDYSYDDFRSFSIIQEGALFSILLEPLRRFMPPLTVYFPPDQGEQIFETLAQHLPHIERELDPIERLMRKIRF